MVAVTQRQWVLAKLEGANYATDSSPTSANAMQVISLDLQPLVGDSVERAMVRPSFGANKTIIANTRHVITITVEFTASVPIAIVNDLSIFSTSGRSRSSQDSELFPVPKSSMAILAPFRWSSRTIR